MELCTGWTMQTVMHSDISWWCISNLFYRNPKKKLKIPCAITAFSFWWRNVRINWRYFDLNNYTSLQYDWPNNGFANSDGRVISFYIFSVSSPVTPRFSFNPEADQKRSLHLFLSLLLFCLNISSYMFISIFSYFTAATM